MMQLRMCVVPLIVISLAFSSAQPPTDQHAAMARWMVNHVTWGAMSTISGRSVASHVGDSFGNPYSWADIKGVPYFYVSDDDASMYDLFYAPAPGPHPGPNKTQWTCSVCNHVYDAAKDGGGKPFEDLPSTWRCPVCGAAKSAYHQYTQADGTVQWVHEHGHAGAGNPRGSITLSDASLTLVNGSSVIQACEIGSGQYGDPENPPCSRLVLTGTFVQMKNVSAEQAAAKAVLFDKHPSFKNYPQAGHSFYVAKLEIDGIWLIDMYGGAAIVAPKDYFAAKLPISRPSLMVAGERAAARQSKQLRTVAGAPPFWEKAKTARWMASELTWGVLSTVSTGHNASKPGDAFGNPYSFADVGGVPYFFASDLDATMIDLFVATDANPRVTLALTEASLTGKLERPQSCHKGPLGDPEDPLCARLVISGKMVKPTAGTDDQKAGLAALFARHPSFKNYPSGHSFYVAKLEIDGIWLIDMFGGAADIKPSDYFKAKI